MVGQCVLLFADVYAWLTYVLVIKNVFFSPEGPWKKKNLAEFGIVTQCIAPQKVNDQYLTNVLLKINAKVSTLEKSYILVPLFIQRSSRTTLLVIFVSVWWYDLFACSL